MARNVLKVTAAALALCVLGGVPGPATAIDVPAKIKGLFSSGNVETFSKRGTPPDTIRQHSEEALTALTSLTFLSESDARQYGRNPQGLLGFYAYVNAENKLVLLGGSRKVTVQEIDLKNDVLFRGVVKKGYDSAIGIPVLQVKLDSQQVAEVSIQDIVTVASGFTADQIACDFPYAWRADARPKGVKQYYYIPNATVSVMSSRRFDSSNQGLTGVFSVLNIGGSRYYSDEVQSMKYFVTVSLTPVSPLDAETCKQVSSPYSAPFNTLQLDKGFKAAFEMSGFNGGPVTAGLDREDKFTGELSTRANPETLRGVTLDVVVERFPGAAQ